VIDQRDDVERQPGRTTEGLGASASPLSPLSRGPRLSLLTALGAAGRGARRRLLIVAADRKAFHDHIKAELADRPEIEVILDRRAGPRRQRPGLRVLERRGQDRRRRPDVDALIRSTGYAIVEVPEGASTAPSGAG
jgi:hypothetical protein